MNNTLIEAFLFSILPIAELRGGIPYAIFNDIHPLTAYIVCVVANILVFPIVYFFLEVIHPIFLKISFYKNLFDKIVIRTRKKLGLKIKKYGFWAIMIFVMIPLPVTGVYTGTLASWLFDIPKKRSFLSIVLGVIISGLIMTGISLFGSEVIKDLFIKNL
ncbi:MAG: small multi-drug export protein [Flavobacteriales bacterium]|nr:small multi-drug export protein [Flavobacteriales bacterium]